MSSLPKKPGPQLWVDVPLPLPGLEEGPPPKAVRVKSGAQKQKEAGVRYVRYRSPKRIPCTHCIAQRQADGTSGINNAVYVRTHGPDTSYLCFSHNAEQRNNEMLGR